MQDFLRKIPLFSEIPDQELEQVCTRARRVYLEQGEILFREGDVGHSAYVIEAGALEIYKGEHSREVLLAERQQGEVVGEIALLEDTTRMASARARADTTLIEIKKEQIDELLRTSLPATSALFHTVLMRWRTTEALLRQNEKMAQLGTLTAGVAHELNNPASALQRGVEHLSRAMQELQESESRLNQQPFDATQLSEIQRLRILAHARAQEPPEFDALTRADLERSLENQLADMGIDQPWMRASGLVDLGWEAEALSSLSAVFTPASLPDVLSFLMAAYQVPALLREIESGALRISTIVAALKSYTYLDQGPTQAVDIHQGLKDTLVILRSKLLSGIRLNTDFSEDLPEIHGYGSELNQVWTNLIDNALDAVGEKGDITLRTRLVGDWLEVEVEDNGPGIPVEIQGRIFDPFFTTKPPGSGTGLGLDISYNIVVHKHKGALSFESDPGKTTFTVRLPRYASD
jgi:signal transduction histidine kinase